MDPLRKRHFVEARQVDPGGKMLFSLTKKGICYAIAYLNLVVDGRIISSNLEDEEQMKGYSDFIQSIPEYEARKKFLFETAKLIMKYNPFDDKGEFVVDEFQDLISLGVKYGVIESA